MYFAEGDVPGLSDEDLQASVATLTSISQTLGLEMARLRERKEQGGIVAEYLMRKILEPQDFMEVRYLLVINNEHNPHFRLKNSLFN